MPQLRLLHRGCISSVFCSGDTDNEHKIVKSYHKGCDLQPRHWLNISREVAILNTLRDLKTPGVVQLCGTLDDAANLCLVFEPCRGGDLYKRLARCGLLSEAQLCKEVIIPLLKVLSQLHSLGIIHRDVKPENIFFDGSGSLVLGDFGLAIRAPERATSRVGTLDYMAPEVLAQPSPDVVALRQLKPRQLPCYDNKVDVWALGVLVYESLMGVTPFGHPDPETASLQAQFRRPASLRPGVSAGCADFVARVLTKQAGLRPSAGQLLGHPWVQQHLEGADVMAYGAAAQQWAGAVPNGSLHSALAANIERVNSCPDSTPTPGSNHAAAAAAAAAGACAQPAAPVMQASASKIDSDKFVNMSHFLQQSLVQQQQQQPQLSIQQRGQRPWEKLVQQHRQQLVAPPTPASAAIAAALAAPNPFGAAAQACIGRSASAHWSVSAFACTALAGCGTAQPPHVALPQSPSAIPNAALLPAAMSAAAASPAPAAVQLASASSLPSALQQSMLCSSTPASPVTDKLGPAFWLLSPQQSAKHVPGQSWGQQHNQQQQQPAILAGLPLYAAGKLCRPAAAAMAAAGPAGAAAASNTQGVLQCHMLDSPMQAQIAAWPMGPVAANPTPAANGNNASYFQLFSPVKAATAAAAASPARPQLLAPTPTPCLVRHASAVMLLQPNPHCASLPPAPMPYRPGLRVQRELLQGTGGPAAAGLAPAGEPGLHASSSELQLQLQAVAVKVSPHAGSSSGSSGFGGDGSSSNCSSRSSSPDVPCCSPASPEPDALLGGSADCCVGLGVLSAGSFGVKQVMPDAFAAAADTAGAAQQHLLLGQAPPVTTMNSAGAACYDAGMSPVGQLLVTTQSAAGFAAAATAAAALPVHTAACKGVGAAGGGGLISSRCCSPSAAASAAVPFIERQAALEEELARAKKTHARSLWKKVQGVCRMVAKPRPLPA